MDLIDKYKEQLDIKPMDEPLLTQDRILQLQQQIMDQLQYEYQRAFITGFDVSSVASSTASAVEIQYTVRPVQPVDYITVHTVLAPPETAEEARQRRFYEELRAVTTPYISDSALYVTAEYPASYRIPVMNFDEPNANGNVYERFGAAVMNANGVAKLNFKQSAADIARIVMEEE